MSSATKVLVLAAAVLLAVSCSRSLNGPVAPADLDTQQAIHSSTGTRHMWGLFDVTIDTDSGTVTALPLRTALYRCNLNHLMELNGPKNLKFANLDLSKFYTEGRLSLDVGLQHPFPGMDQYTGFDVWGVFMHDGHGLMTYDSLTFAQAGLDGVLENADGYTRWFNANEFTGQKIAGYTPGVVGTKDFTPSAHLNPYKLFADGLDKNEDIFAFLATQSDFEKRCMFRPGSLNWRRYNLLFPMSGGSPVLKFQYAVLASWVPPDKNPPLNIPGDFSLRANLQEANAVSVLVTETPWFSAPGDWGGNLALELRVFDWQGAMENPSGIPGEIHDIKVAGDFLPATWSGTFEVIGTEPNCSVVQIEIQEPSMDITKTTGEFWVIVESAEPSDYADDGLIPPGKYPDNAHLAAFVRVPITFGTKPQPGLLDLVEVTPPGWPAVIKDVWVENNIAYCVGPPGGMIVFDVSGPGNPVYMGGKYLEGEGNEIEVEGGYAYVADGEKGLVVLSVADPAHPQIAGSYVGTNAEGVFVLDGLCYLADGKGGLKVIDVGGGTHGGSPSNPKLEGQIGVGYAANDVWVEKGIAYVTDYETAFLTIDVGGGTQGGSPSSPKLEGSLPGLSWGEEIIGMMNGYVYVADNGKSYRICTIDVNWPASPQLMSSATTPAAVHDLWISDGYLYAATDTSGLRIYLIPPSEPPIPAFMVSYDTPGNAYGVCKAGNYAYVADYHHGLRKIDVSKPNSPSESGKYFTPFYPYDLQAVNGYIYLADSPSGLIVMDIGGGGAGTHQLPLACGIWINGADSRGVWVENGYAYLGGGWFNKHFFVADVGASAGSPQNPVGIADITTPTFQGTLGLMKMGSYVYATAWEDGLKVFDVDGGALGGTPNNPKYVTTKPTNCSWGLWAEGGYVYMADGDNYGSKFYVYDVGGGGTGSPTNPAIADSETSPVHLYDVELVGGYAYVCGGDGLRVYDVGAGTGAPNNIKLVGTYNIGYPVLSRGLCVSQGYAFIACSTGELRAIDVGGGQAGGSPTSPQFVDSVNMPFDCFEVIIDGNYAYVASHAGGLRIVQVWQ